MITYTITISKKEDYTTKGQEYHVLADTGNEKDNGRVYGYIDAMVEKNRTTQIYEQIITDPDEEEISEIIGGVIGQINFKFWRKITQ